MRDDFWTNYHREQARAGNRWGVLLVVFLLAVGFAANCLPHH